MRTDDDGDNGDDDDQDEVQILILFQKTKMLAYKHAILASKQQLVFRVISLLNNYWSYNAKNNYRLKVNLTKGLFPNQLFCPSERAGNKMYLKIFHNHSVSDFHKIDIFCKFLVKIVMVVNRTQHWIQNL